MPVKPAADASPPEDLPPVPPEEPASPLAWYDLPWVRHLKLSTVIIVAATLGAAIRGCWVGEGPPTKPSNPPAASDEDSDEDWPESPF